MFWIGCGVGAVVGFMAGWILAGWLFERALHPGPATVLLRSTPNGAQRSGRQRPQKAEARNEDEDKEGDGEPVLSRDKLAEAILAAEQEFYEAQRLLQQTGSDDARKRYADAIEEVERLQRLANLILGME
jgi:hypothetical protein